MKRGFACGVFDLYHSGHVKMLMECKSNCDYLIVALNEAKNLPTEKNVPIFSIEERKLILQSCKYVDEVLTYTDEDELLMLLETKNIHLRFLGEDYKNKSITGQNLNIPIYYTDRSHGLSTSNYIKKILNRYAQLHE